MKNKAILLLIGTSLLATIGITTIVNNQSLIFKTDASGIIQDGNNRTFVLDSALDIAGSVGTKDIGTLSVYATNASAQDGYVTRLSNKGKLLVYCPTGGYYTGNYFKGFSSSSINSITLTFDDEVGGAEIRMSWARFKNDYSSISRFTGTGGVTVTTTSDNSGEQTLEATSGFINSKTSATSEHYSCLYFDINTDGKTLDIKSITVEYSCN